MIVRQKEMKRFIVEASWCGTFEILHVTAESEDKAIAEFNREFLFPCWTPVATCVDGNEILEGMWRGHGFKASARG